MERERVVFVLALLFGFSEYMFNKLYIIFIAIRTSNAALLFGHKPTDAFWFPTMSDGKSPLSQGRTRVVKSYLCKLEIELQSVPSDSISRVRWSPTDPDVLLVGSWDSVSPTQLAALGQ